MRQIRRANERGHADHGWLDTWHTFSFADYYDPRQMGFRALRVINDDRVAGGTGFGTHPHREMEILTYVLSGEQTLRPGEWQRLSAGTGMTHSEHNADPRTPVHLYQIWIVPEQRGGPPTYEQRRFDGEGKQLIASPDDRDGSLTIRQDARVYLLRPSGASLTHELGDGRHAWVQVTKGQLQFGDDVLKAGDGVAVSDEQLSLRGDGEAILFDLA